MRIHVYIVYVLYVCLLLIITIIENQRTKITTTTGGSKSETRTISVIQHLQKKDSTNHLTNHLLLPALCSVILFFLDTWHLVKIKRAKKFRYQCSFSTVYLIM